MDYDTSNPARFAQLMQSEEVQKDAVQIMNDTLDRELKQAKLNNANMSASLTALDRKMAEVVKERDELKEELEKLKEDKDTSPNDDAPKRGRNKKAPGKDRSERQAGAESIAP